MPSPPTTSTGMRAATRRSTASTSGSRPNSGGLARNDGRPMPERNDTAGGAPGNGVTDEPTVRLMTTLLLPTTI